MSDIPFPILDWRSDQQWQAKSFFNYVCEQNTLVTVLEAISRRHSYAYNEEECVFPDLDDPDPYFHFVGVKFGVSGEEVNVTEGDFWYYVQRAALFWMERNEADTDALRRILRRIPD